MQILAIQWFVGNGVEHVLNVKFAINIDFSNFRVGGEFLLFELILFAVWVGQVHCVPRDVRVSC